MVPRCQGLKGGSLDNVSVSKALRLDHFTALKGGLVVSCQVPTGTAIDTPAFISAQAQTVVQAGAVGIRAQGVENVRAVKKLVDVPVIGLVKRYLDTSAVYITPLLDDVLDLVQAGVEIVAIDATKRLRPNGVTLEKFMEQIREKTDVAILADVDSIESALLAQSLGCDAVATTLSGYTEIAAPELPNIELVAELAAQLKIPVVAEGGYHEQEQVVQALKFGAWTVCVGTAITNPYLLTQHFVNGILKS
jgi:N-acylglucosamine-6-phosphate 2-epimerase